MELFKYSQLSLNGHLYKIDTLLKWTPIVFPCLSLFLLVDSIQDGHTVPVPKVSILEGVVYTVNSLLMDTSIRWTPP